MEKGHWIKGHDRLYGWNMCSHCYHKVLNSIFGDEYTPDTCPECGIEMVVPMRIKKEEKITERSRCTLPYCAGMKSREDCLICGFNAVERARRLALPWSINEQGMLYKNIHITEDKT